MTPVPAEHRQLVAALLREAQLELFPSTASYGDTRQQDFLFRRLVGRAITNGEKTGFFCVGGSLAELLVFMSASFDDWRKAARDIGIRSQKIDSAASGPVINAKWSSCVGGARQTRVGNAGFSFRPASEKGEGGDLLLYGWVRGSVEGLEFDTPRFNSVPETVRLAGPNDFSRQDPCENAEGLTKASAVAGEGVVERNLAVLNDPALHAELRRKLSSLSPEKLVEHDSTIRELRRQGNHIGVLVKTLGVLTAVHLLVYLTNPAYAKGVDKILTSAIGRVIELFQGRRRNVVAAALPSLPPNVPPTNPSPESKGPLSRAPDMTRLHEGRDFIFAFISKARLVESGDSTGLEWGKNCRYVTEVPGKALVTFYTSEVDQRLHFYVFSGFVAPGSCVGAVEIGPEENSPTQIDLMYYEEGFEGPMKGNHGQVQVDRVIRDGLPFCRMTGTADIPLAEANSFAVSLGFRHSVPGKSRLYGPVFGTYRHDVGRGIGAFRYTYPQVQSVPKGTVSTESVIGPLACTEGTGRPN